MMIDFKAAEHKGKWRIVNDSVMGGRSQSEIVFSDSGTAVFKGNVSLENNGGFASVRGRSVSNDIDDYTGLSVKVFGDGKDYQLRVRTNERFDGISYRSSFSTKSAEWTIVEIPFSDFVPVFRGRIIESAGPLSPEQIQQVGFLIADKQTGTFRLEIEWIKAYK